MLTLLDVLFSRMLNLCVLLLVIFIVFFSLMVVEEDPEIHEPIRPEQLNLYNLN